MTTVSTCKQKMLYWTEYPQWLTYNWTVVKQLSVSVVYCQYWLW